MFAGEAYGQQQRCFSFTGCTIRGVERYSKSHEWAKGLGVKSGF
jgi:hypothetical protein